METGSDTDAGGDTDTDDANPNPLISPAIYRGDEEANES